MANGNLDTINTEILERLLLQSLGLIERDLAMKPQLARQKAQNAMANWIADGGACDQVFLKPAYLKEVMNFCDAHNIDYTVWEHTSGSNIGLIIKDKEPDKSLVQNEIDMLYLRDPEENKTISFESIREAAANANTKLVSINLNKMYKDIKPEELNYLVSDALYQEGKLVSSFEGMKTYTMSQQAFRPKGTDLSTSLAALSLLNNEEIISKIERKKYDIQIGTEFIDRIVAKTGPCILGSPKKTQGTYLFYNGKDIEVHNNTGIICHVNPEDYLRAEVVKDEDGKVIDKAVRKYDNLLFALSPYMDKIPTEAIYTVDEWTNPNVIKRERPTKSSPNTKIINEIKTMLPMLTEQAEIQMKEAGVTDKNGIIKKGDTANFVTTKFEYILNEINSEITKDQIREKLGIKTKDERLNFDEQYKKIMETMMSNKELLKQTIQVEHPKSRDIKEQQEHVQNNNSIVNEFINNIKNATSNNNELTREERAK